MALLSRLLTFAAKLDLGSHYDSAMCGGGPATTYYPSIYVSGREKEIELPESGKAVVEYVVTGRSWNERKGKARHSADIEIRSIEPMGKDAKDVKKLPGAATQLSALRPGMISFDRTRNSDGQYAPESDESGITPETTASAYGAMGGGPGLLRRSVGPVAAGGTAAGAALLARAALKAKGKK